MNPFIQKILVGADLSDCSKGAVQYALTIGKKGNARVDLIHVVEFQPGMDEKSPVAKIYLEAYWKQVGPELESMEKQVTEKIGEAGCIQQVGMASDAINQTALKKGTDLVVVGSHGWSGLDRVLLGSTAERVIRGAPCPVLAVRWLKDERDLIDFHSGTQLKSGNGASGASFNRMLIPVDFSDGSIEAMEYGVQFAKYFSVSVDLLHVGEPPGYGLDFTLIYPFREKLSRSELEAKLRRLSEIFQSQGINTEQAVMGGTASETILTYIQDHSIDLVLMGTHGRRGVSRWVSGSVAEAVLRHAPCPVLTVKSPRFSKGHPLFSSIPNRRSQSI